MRVFTIACLLLVMASGVWARSQNTNTYPETWNSQMRSAYEAVLEADRSLKEPWQLKAAATLQGALDGTANGYDLEILARDFTATKKPLRECAEAIILLQIMRGNHKGLFLQALNDFRKSFPKSSYTEFVEPKKLLQLCQRCKGRSRAKEVDCHECKNTRMCQTCRGRGVHIHEPMLGDKKPWSNSRTRNSSSRSSRVKKVDSYRTPLNENYMNDDDTYPDTYKRKTPCIKCKGKKSCVACAQKMKKIGCAICNSTGYVANTKKVNEALNKVVALGQKALETMKGDDIEEWNDSNTFKAKWATLRQENDVDKLIASIQNLTAQHPKAVQRIYCDRFLLQLRAVKSAQIAAHEKLTAEQNAIRTANEALTRGIAEAEKDFASFYKRKEALTRLTMAYPKARTAKNSVSPSVSATMKLSVWSKPRVMRSDFWRRLKTSMMG